MAKYIFSVKGVKYGIPTGVNTMPVTKTALPDTVKGTVAVTETDPSVQKFFVDQKQAPIRVVDSASGELSFSMQFYDMTYATLVAIKGGSAVAAVPGVSAAKWRHGATFSSIALAIEVETDSGQYFNFYNAFIIAKITGSGSRDGMFAVEMQIQPQLAADLSGDYEIADVVIPTV